MQRFRHSTWFSLVKRLDLLKQSDDVLTRSSSTLVKSSLRQVEKVLNF